MVLCLLAMVFLMLTKKPLFNKKNESNYKPCLKTTNFIKKKMEFKTSIENWCFWIFGLGLHQLHACASISRILGKQVQPTPSKMMGTTAQIVTQTLKPQIPKIAL
jgi:hypothetical protein